MTNSASWIDEAVMSVMPTNGRAITQRQIDQRIRATGKNLRYGESNVAIHRLVSEGKLHYTSDFSLAITKKGK